MSKGEFHKHSCLCSACGCKWEGMVFDELVIKPNSLECPSCHLITGSTLKDKTEREIIFEMIMNIPLPANYYLGYRSCVLGAVLPGITCQQCKELQHKECKQMLEDCEEIWIWRRTYPTADQPKSCEGCEHDNNCEDDFVCDTCKNKNHYQPKEK
jgi:hypothetical protein